MKRIFVAVLMLALAVMIAPIAAQDEPVEIPVWIAFTDYRLDWAQERAAEFNEQFPQFRVVVEGYPSYEELLTSARLAFEQRSAPAVVQYFEAATRDALDAEFQGTPRFKSIEVALDGAMELNGLEVDLDKFVEPVANYYRVDGQLASMPWNTSSAIMFANQEIFDAAGVEIPTTWAEVEEACAAILALENAPANCITWPNHGWFFEQSVAQQGADLVNNGNGRDDRATEVAVASDAAIEYVSWWKSLQDAGYYVYTGQQRDWGGTYNLFIQQNVAMLIYSSSDTTVLTTDGAEAGFTTVAAPMPYNQEVGYTGNLIGGASLWLSNELDPLVEEGALTFLLWFTNAENDADWHRVTGYIPVTQPGLDLLEAEGWFEANPNSLVASTQLAASADTSATRGAIVGDFPIIRDQVTEAIEDILVNNVDIAQRLQEAQEEAQNILDDYNADLEG